MNIADNIMLLMGTFNLVLIVKAYFIDYEEVRPKCKREAIWYYAFIAYFATVIVGIIAIVIFNLMRLL